MRASIDGRVRARLPIIRAISTRGRASGFTLVELILALGILGVVLSTLIFLRLEAVERVTKVVEERELRRAAQEVLEECLAKTMSNELEDLAGEIPDKPGWTWEWNEEVNQEGDEFILSYTVVITYPDPDATEDDGDEALKRYELTEWLLPTDEQREYILEQQQLMLEEGITGVEGYGEY